MILIYCRPIAERTTNVDCLRLTAGYRCETRSRFINNPIQAEKVIIDAVNRSVFWNTFIVFQGRGPEKGFGIRNSERFGLLKQKYIGLNGI